MLLLRIAGLILTPAPLAGLKAELTLGDTRVEVTGGPERNGGRWHLAVAHVPLVRRPKRTADCEVVIPDRERRVATVALETAANVLSLSFAARRSLSSPNPYIALLAETPEEERWLAESPGLHRGLDGVARQSLRVQLPLDSDAIHSLRDRWDGVALMAEALSADHATGRFIEFMRVFERAFGLAAGGIAASLSAFLDPRFGYHTAEIEHWTMTLRGSAAHADRRRTFVLESDVRPHLARVEQAAWDVLLNKESWRDDLLRRRRSWTPDGGLVTAKGDLVAAQYSTPNLIVELNDRWEEFPLDLESRVRVPANWWPRPPERLGTVPKSFTVVPQEEWYNA